MTGTRADGRAADQLRPVTIERGWSEQAEIDTLVLGCTHYPLLAGAIQYVMGESVTLVSSAEETAFDVYRTLVRHGLERTAPGRPSYLFEATGDSKDEFLRLASRFLGPEVTTVDLVETGAIPITKERP